MTNWKIYDPLSPPVGQRISLPPAPPWRQPGQKREAVLARTFKADPEVVDAVNTALYLRRPLLLTGRPGTGKSSLAHSVAHQLGLGSVIEWAVNSRSTLQEGLYQYDALARLQYIQQASARSGAGVQAEKAEELGMFLTLGPLGTALASPNAPRALLVDEIDKSDVDLPNDLLNVLDTGHFVIPELKRAAARHPKVRIPARGEEIDVHLGEITFTEYPFIVMTSNGERDFPAPFLRRCVQCQIREPNESELQGIVEAHFDGLLLGENVESIISDFVKMRNTATLATDQLLNAVHLLLSSDKLQSDADRKRMLFTVFQELDG
ncbi:AAA family ATPase [Herbaspirillum rubrisubalbicans]|uniref:AAA family ATPase n=1 Tax=Herbaspirillum rubrisubalbicans TaxID=80842 RepID=A0AAD0U7H5_9BURK|nr:MoxR family ATPase [Herbaspirillum rubrisubalbicans]AYR24509.1 AAA family ATPase [Herbaspirillum rubrisubalbicans]